MEPAPTIKDFFSCYVRNMVALMTGILSIPFAISAPFLESPTQKIAAGVFALACFLVSIYFVWASERKKLIEAVSKLAKIGAQLSLMYENSAINWNWGNSTAEINFLFQNVGNEMLAYEVRNAIFSINDVGLNAVPEKSRTNVHAGQKAQFSVDANNLPKLDLSKPAIIVVGIAAEYDNIEPTCKRFTKRTVRYEFHSLDPLLLHKNEITEIEDGYL